MRKRDKSKISKRNRPQCGLCGSTENLTKTPCCDNWICNDMDDYVMFSYEHNSCMRNHFKYTICGHHFHSNHSGPWQKCKKCVEDFKSSLELFADFSTNEYNFEILDNPPEFEPTLCSKCGRRIKIGQESYTVQKKKHICSDCETVKIPDFTKQDLLPAPNKHIDDEPDYDDYDDFLEHKPDNLTYEAINSVPKELKSKFENTFALLLQFIFEYNIETLGILSIELLISFAVQFPDVFKKARPASWAAGIIHSLGTINFLSDPDYEPYIESSEIHSFFKVSKSTMQSKSEILKRLFQMFYMDPDWSTPENLLACDMFWKVETDEGIIDFRNVAEAVQHTAVKDDIIPMAPFLLKEGIEFAKSEINSLKQMFLEDDPIIDQNKVKDYPKIIKFSDHNK